MAFVLLIPTTVFATEGYVSSTDDNIKITYHKDLSISWDYFYEGRLMTETYPYLIGTVQNISEKQIDNIIIKISEFGATEIEDSVPLNVSSLRPNEISYFAKLLERQTSCYQLFVNNYDNDASQMYKSDEPTQIFDDYDIESFEIEEDRILITVRNNGEGSTQMGVLVVAYDGEEIVDFSVDVADKRTGSNKKYDFEFRQRYADNFDRLSYSLITINDKLSYDIIVTSWDLKDIDFSNTSAGTKYAKFYSTSVVHQSQHYSEIPFGNTDYRVGTCENGSTISEDESKTPQIPEWVKNNAKWWADGQLDDRTFTQGIGHLIKEKIITISDIPKQSSGVTEEKVPEWIKNNAKWWADGMISEDDFITGIKYLVENGIVRPQ